MYSIVHIRKGLVVASCSNLRRAMQWIAAHEDGPRTRWTFEFRKV